MEAPTAAAFAEFIAALRNGKQVHEEVFEEGSLTWELMVYHHPGTESYQFQWYSGSHDFSKPMLSEAHILSETDLITALQQKDYTPEKLAALLK